MAVIGFEIDQVRRVKNSKGSYDDISVPISVAYNHHFGESKTNLMIHQDNIYRHIHHLSESTMSGGSTEFKQVNFTG